MLASVRTAPALFVRPVTIARTIKRGNLRLDLIAGITVAVVSLPQGLAYALVAGLPPVMGLYAAIIIPIVAALWGSSRQVQSTPTTALSLLVLSSLSATFLPNSPNYIVAAGLLAVFAGLVQVILGIARLGLLVNFVSDAVIIGFAAGAGILIAAGELRHLFGLNFSSSTLADTLTQLAGHISETNLATLAFGLTTLAIMLLIRRFKPKWPAPLISLIVPTLIMVLIGSNAAGVKVIGALPLSLPPFTPLPVLNLSFIAALAPSALAVAALGLIQTMAIARTLAAQTGERLDNDQEFMGQGLANIASGFFSGYPGCGSISCSVINAEAGAQTQLAAVLSGVFTLVGMFVLAPFGAYIPRAALSGVLIVVGIAMIDLRKMRYVWRGSRSDTIIMLVTLFSTLLFRIDFAVLLGILASLTVYIVKTSTPQVQPVVPDDSYRHLVHQPQKPMCPQLAIFDILGDLYFGAVNHVDNALHQHRLRHPEQRYLLLRMRSVELCDISGIHMLENVVRTYREHGGDVFLMRVREPVLDRMQRSGFAQYLGDDHFLDDDSAIGYLFYRVLDPAICIYECHVRVFKECQNLPRPDYPVTLPLNLDFTPGSTAELTPQELWQRLHSPQPPLVIDVREPREYQRAHIVQAQVRPLSALITSPPDLPRDRSIVLVCLSGRRSRRVAYWLQQQGYAEIAVLNGGMRAWEAAGLFEAVT